jgi:hypothetical protein
MSRRHGPTVRQNGRRLSVLRFTSIVEPASWLLQEGEDRGREEAKPDLLDDAEPSPVGRCLFPAGQEPEWRTKKERGSFART